MLLANNLSSIPFRSHPVLHTIRSISMLRHRRERSYSCFVEEIWQKAHVPMPRHRRERVHIRFVEGIWRKAVSADHRVGNMSGTDIPEAQPLMTVKREFSFQNIVNPKLISIITLSLATLLYGLRYEQPIPTYGVPPRP